MLIKFDFHDSAMLRLPFLLFLILSIPFSCYIVRLVQVYINEVTCVILWILASNHLPFQFLTALSVPNNVCVNCRWEKVGGKAKVVSFGEIETFRFGQNLNKHTVTFSPRDSPP